MISIKGPWNNVGIGNHFFIYAYIRLLAEKLNYTTNFEPMYFSERQGVHAQKQYQFKNIDVGIDTTVNEKYGIDDGFAAQHESIDGAVDYFKNNNFYIESHGYYQKYNYWKPYKKQVKLFFQDFIAKDTMPTDTVAIHLRKSLQDPTISLPDYYYLEAINQINCKNIYLFADNFDRHQSILDALKAYNPIIMNLNVPDTIRTITSFNNIICSQGSFSFWVAFLSNADNIIWPITSTGPNKLENNWSINYKVDDESRYQFINIV
jgi:hypothetical protein